MKKKVVTEFEYKDTFSNRNYTEEAYEILGLSEEEKQLADKLRKGPVSLNEIKNAGIENLSPAFGHTDKEVYLYPVVAAYMSGELPDTEYGTLPKGMELLFPSYENLYGGSEIVEEITTLFGQERETDDETGYCYVLYENKKRGALFLAKQVACRLGMPLLIWDGIQTNWQELLLTAALYDALICVDVRNTEIRSKNLTEKLKQLSYRVTRFLVLLRERKDAEELAGKVRSLFREVPVTVRADREECLKDYMENSGITIPDKIHKKLTDSQYTMQSFKQILNEFSAQAQIASEGVLTEKAASRIVDCYVGEETGLFAIRQLSGNCSLSDLCLPKEQRQKITNICAMLTKREKVMKEWGFAEKYTYGNGISILFYGAPGTGKTMAAQAVAGELGMPLYRVDLSQLISKYIGETQKNIGKIFEQAKALKGILLFDEADALFARRNEVSDAQDKYSNAETAYLLQRIEECDGICILATNLLHNFDEAFRRRITYMMNFPMPDEGIREQIWKKVFPAQAELSEDVDTELLAECFELSGAAIKSAAVQGAFQAAVEEVPIGMKHLLGSIANEYKKMNKSLKPEQRAMLEKYEADFV